MICLSDFVKDVLCLPMDLLSSKGKMRKRSSILGHFLSSWWVLRITHRCSSTVGTTGNFLVVWEHLIVTAIWCLKMLEKCGLRCPRLEKEKRKLLLLTKIGLSARCSFGEILWSLSSEILSREVNWISVLWSKTCKQLGFGPALYNLSYSGIWLGRTPPLIAVRLDIRFWCSGMLYTVVFFTNLL